jgi:hypothetical protein
MQASIQCAASTVIQLNPVRVALESNHNALNQLKFLVGKHLSIRTRSFNYCSSEIFACLAFVGPECPDRLFWEEILEQNMDLEQGHRHD